MMVPMYQFWYQGTNFVPMNVISLSADEDLNPIPHIDASASTKIPIELSSMRAVFSSQDYSTVTLQSPEISVPEGEQTCMCTNYTVTPEPTVINFSMIVSEQNRTSKLLSMSGQVCFPLPEGQYRLLVEAAAKRDTILDISEISLLANGTCQNGSSAAGTFQCCIFRYHALALSG